MKIKLTTLLFGLLLAVGWTSNASAQALPQANVTERLDISSAMMNAPVQAPMRAQLSEVVHDKAYYQQFKYNWTDGVGDTAHVHTNVDPTEPATNPYQIYELLRFIYGNPNFPGPTYSAYTPSYLREDEVYYGSIAGGWDITAAGGSRDIVIDVYQGYTSYPVAISSIQVKSGNTVISGCSWSYSSNGSSLPTGWTNTGTIQGYNTNNNQTSNNGNSIRFSDYGGSITIPAELLTGYNNVTVVINAKARDTDYNYYRLTVNGEAQNLSSTSFKDYTWNVTLPAEGTDFVQGSVIAPYEDGYTVVLVALKDSADMTLEPEISPSSSTYFTQKSQLITYFKNNLEYVRLLTDGLRIGDGQGTGTVFNCDGRLNRFFFLGKGQARKKAPRILDRIANQWSYTSGWNTYTYQDWWGEDVPFKEMFEQFSPTSPTVSSTSQTLDLFDKLKEGNVYNVQHDCGSVMQAEHEFSLAGKQGTEHFAFSGLNFFVPDYRLLFWTAPAKNYTSHTADGRDNLPYEDANQNYTQPGESHGDAFIDANTNYSAWSAYFAQYNPTYAPKIGIYKITLDAEAIQRGTSHASGNLNYDVKLTWVSSLNQMSGKEVPQTYTVYLVDENGNRTELHPESITFYDASGNELTEANPFSRTQVVYKVPQNEHSYTIEYIVHGRANQAAAFEAWSNRASVIIPGWNDFVGLQLNHHESDFQPNYSGKRVNWYRNFLAMVNEDIVNGLTVSKITGANDETQMNEFGLYRFLYNDQDKPIMPGTKVATITFDPDQANDQQVKYKVTYTGQDVEQEIEPYTLTYKEGSQTVTVANAYNRDKMDILDEGWIRVKGNGDIVIWPNNYYAYIKSITVYRNQTGNQTVPNATWTAPNALPTSWYVSPGSKWENFTTNAGDQVGYMEGGGYIAIPDVLDTYPNARVVIVAYGESGNVCRLTVNDQTRNLTATSSTYEWENPSPNGAPQRATETQIVTEGFEDDNVFPTLNLGGITADNHTGRFGDWTIYDATGANVYGPNNLTWEDKYSPQAWTPFNSSTITFATAYNGSKYIESVCPSTGVAADSWLISPELSGNAQTITFYARIFSTTYTPETFEVLYSTTDIDRSNFENSVSSFTVAQSYSSSTTTWTQYSANLPEGAKYFAIRHTSNDKYGIMVDDVKYEITNELPAQEGGLLRLHLLMVDQLKAEIPEDNSHEDAYGYVLKWEQPANSEDHKQSGTVRVNIQKTDCEVEGYYTLDQIDNDKNIGSVVFDEDNKATINHDQGLTMDVLTADVEFNLSSTNDQLYYYDLLGKENNYPGEKDYLSQLFRQDDFTYREMYTESPDFNEVYNSGEHHYFDDSTPIKRGTYGDPNSFMSYAPQVTTWGVDRRYYEYDGKDNTYGAPIWKTAVGKAVLNSVTAERQENNTNSVTWTTAAGPASLYILDGIEAEGYLPPSNLTKIEFEPYMFRVFVESKSGKLRPYKTVEAGVDPNKPGEHLDALVPDNQLTDAQKYGPQCVWSGYVKYNEETGAMIQDDTENGATIKPKSGDNTGTIFTYNKDKVDRTGGSDANPLGEWDKDTQNAMFGALDAMTLDDKNLIIEDDLKFFVRFYFAVKGHSVGHTVGAKAEAADRPGNGAESPGKSGGSATAVKEITYVGEIVGQTYFNVQGMQSDKPFDGVNIVVTRFSDGTTSVSKVVR